jgi:hypothetical protein
MLNKKVLLFIEWSTSIVCAGREREREGDRKNQAPVEQLH